MAEGLGASLTIGGDWSPLANALRSADASLTATGNTATQAGKKVTEAGQAGAKGWSGLKVTLDGVAEAEKKTGAAAEAAGQKAAAAAKAAASSWSGVAVVMKDVEKGAKQAEGAMQGFTAASRAASAAVAGMGLGLIAKGLETGLVDAARQFATFEQSLQQVRAVSDATAQDLQALRQAALDSGAATGLGAQAAAGGLVELAKAGFTAKESIAALPGVMALARAGGVSVSDAAELAGGTLRGFGLEASKSAQVADIMAQAANKSAVDIRDLHESMKYVAPVAAASGQSIQEMSASLAIMGNNMIKGSQAGTSIREAITRLIKPHKEGADALHALGISVQDTHGKMLPLSDVMTQLREKTEGLTQVEKQRNVTAIFGVEAMSGVLSLLNQTPAAYDAMLASMQGADGAAKAMGDTMSKGLGPAVTALGASVEQAKIAIGEGLAPALMNVTNSIKGVVDGFNQLTPSTKNAAGAMLVGVTSFTLLAGGGAALIGVLVAMAAAIEFVGAPLALVVGGAALASGAIAGYTTNSIEAARASEESAKAEEAHQAKLLEVVTSARANATELQSLIDTHDALIDKTNLTTKEQHQLKESVDTLHKKYPQLAGAVDAAGQAHWATLAPMDAEIKKQQQLVQQTYATIEAEMKLAKIIMASSGVDAQNANAEASRLNNHTGTTWLIETPQRMIANDIMQRTDARFEANKQRVISLDRIRSQAAPPAPHGAPDRGATVAGGGGHGGRGKGHHPADTRAQDLRTSEQEAKQEADAQAKLDEAIAARHLATVKATHDAEITLLHIKHDAGLASEEDVARGVSTINLQKLAAQAQFDKDRVAAQTTAAQAELQNQERAANDAAALHTAAGDKAARAETSKAAATRLHLKALAEQALGIDDRLNAEKAANALKLQEDLQKIEIRRREQTAQVGREEVAMAQETAAKRAQVAQAGMGYFDRMAAASVQSFNEERQAAQRAFDDTERGLIALAKTDVDVMDAQKANAERLEAVKAAINARERLANEVLYREKMASLRDFQSTIGNLATNPGGVLADIAGDPEKLSKWGTAIKAIPGAVTEAKGAFDALTSGAAATANGLAALGTIGSAAAGGIGLVVTIVQQIAGAFQQAEAARKALSDGMKSLARDAADDTVAAMASGTSAEKRAQSDAGARNTYAKAVEDAKTKYNGKASEIMASLIKSGQTSMLPASLQGKPIEAATAGDFAATQAGLDAALAAADRALADALAKSAHEETAAAKQLADDTTGILTASLKDKADAAKVYTDLITTQAGAALADIESDMKAQVDAAAALAKSRDELAAGGRDERGNKVSLEAERALTVSKLVADSEKRIADLKDQQLRATEDMRKIDEDERKKIDDVLNAGMAIRAKTEFQDKTDKIGDIRKAADEARAAKAKDLADLRAREVEERSNADNEKARINTLASERIAALNQEITQGAALLEQSKQQLALDYARLALAQTMAVIGGYSGAWQPVAPSVQTNYDPAGLTYQDGRWDTAPKHHSGIRRVPGAPGQDVRAILRAGEAVLTQRQLSTLMTSRPGDVMRQGLPSSQFVSDAMRATGGAGPVDQSIHLGEVHVYTQATDTRAIAKDVMGELARQVRTRGGLRI